jgi:uncharacterized membrane protein YhaH (DUF805 family)
MGALSLMHWFIVLFPALTIAVVIRVTKGSSKILSRGGFVLRVLGVYIANVILYQILGAVVTKSNIEILSGIQLIALVISFIFIAYFLVGRLRDTGKSVNCAFFMAIPVVGGVLSPITYV